MATSGSATSSTVEQGLVVRRVHPADQSWQHGSETEAPVGREGKGRGDAARLLSRRSLRRVWRHRGRRKLEESSGFIEDGARGCASHGKRHGNVFRVRTSLRAREARQRVTRTPMDGDVHLGSQMKQADRTRVTNGATRLESHDPDRSVHAGPGWRARGRQSSPKGLSSREDAMETSR
jgi:hypothetical protein